MQAILPIALFVLILAQAIPGRAMAQQRHALVVGINDYANLVDLNTAVNDARAVGAALARVGFRLHEGYDLNRPDFARLISGFTAALGPDDEAVVFYAGHAVAIQNANHLVPADASNIRQSDETLIVSESIGLDFLLEAIARTGARLSVVILDACRDNPFQGLRARSGGTNAGLAITVPPRGVFILFSADQGQQALDGLGPDDPDANSVFTRALLPLMEEPGLDIVDVARRLRGRVQQMAASVGHEQFPVYRDRMQGDGRFAFRPAEAPSPAPSPAVPETPGDLTLAPTRLRVGDELTVSALPEPACDPFFFNLGPDGMLTPVPMEFFQTRADTGGRTRYVIDGGGRYGLVVTPQDAAGRHRFGYLCQPARLGQDGIIGALGAIAAGAGAAGVVAIDGQPIRYVTRDYEVLR